MREDDRGNKPEYSRAYRRSDHPSSQCGQRQIVDQCGVLEFRGDSKHERLIDCRNRSECQSMPACAPLEPSDGFALPAIENCVEALEFPFLSIRYIVQIGFRPVYDFHVPVHENYITAGAVHHNSGKSFGCGWLCLALELRDFAKAGGWYWCVGQTLDRSIGGQQQELWKALPRWMFGKQVWDAKGGFGSGHHAKLQLPTSDGGRCLVEFRSADQDLSTFEQAKLDGVWIDERCPEAIYGRLIPRIVDKNGFILYSDIPEQFWQLERLQEAPPDAGVYFQHYEMWDNQQNLPEGSINKASARMTQDERDQKISGKFLVMEGIVYREYRDSIHAIEPFPIPKHWPKWRSIDYGGSSPTACLWFALGPNEHIFIYREHYERGPSVSTHSVPILQASGDEEYVATLIDPAAYNQQPGMSETIAQQYEKGLKCTVQGWPKTNEMGEHAMVQKVKYRLENQTLWVFTPLVNTRREFRAHKYALDKDGKPKTSDSFENANNHALDTIKGFVATNPTFDVIKSAIFRRSA